jgi:hypothetical protein
MRRWAIFTMFGCLLLGTAAACSFWLFPSWWDRSSSTNRRSPDAYPPVIVEAHLSPAEVEAVLAPRKSKLPETEPPPGLPILAWGTRDLFPTIRVPQFLTAEQGGTALAKDEPVLGLALGKESRAYSTNQLNKHEMVIDEIAGIPILVTY